MAARMFVPVDVRSLAGASRLLSTTSVQCGRKSRVPYDKRFPVTAKHAKPSLEGGSAEMVKWLAVHNVQPTGFHDRRIGRWRNVKEMIPEFIVPDLTNFELKPYVSYKVPDVTQSEFTARDLFNACYAEKIVEEVKEGKRKLPEASPPPQESSLSSSSDKS